MQQGSKEKHTVGLSKAFYLGKYEVTQAQWEAVMEDNPSQFKGDAALPVENVSWEDVQEFISRLNARERDTAIYRLPTEAEWEYAARAGSTTVYSFGDSMGDLDRYARKYKATFHASTSAGATGGSPSRASLAQSAQAAGRRRLALRAGAG